jgi:nitroreductase
MTFAFILGASHAFGQDVILPSAQKSDQPNSLTKALQERHSVRSYLDKTIPDQMLSDLLWAANGVNRSDGKRTAPSAINSQDIELYVYKKDVGVFHYAAAANKLEKVGDTDIRTIIGGRNTFINTVPYVILLVSNQAKFNGMKSAGKLGAMDAGYVSQNIYLYCAANGLATVACAPPMDAAAVQKALGLTTDYLPLIYHPIGYAK